jgi:heme oxygenase
MSQTPADIAHLVGLENKIHDVVDQVDDALQAAATEREYNRALQRNIVFQEQLNALIVHQAAIRNDALRQLELYRFGLGRLTEEVTGKRSRRSVRKSVNHA